MTWYGSNISGEESLLRQIGVRVPDLLRLPVHVVLPAKAPQSGERVADLFGLLLRVPTPSKAPRSGEGVL